MNEFRGSFNSDEMKTDIQQLQKQKNDIELNIKSLELVVSLLFDWLISCLSMIGCFSIDLSAVCLWLDVFWLTYQLFVYDWLFFYQSTDQLLADQLFISIGSSPICWSAVYFRLADQLFISDLLISCLFLIGWSAGHLQ